jgi:hypothetical protein
VAQEQVISIRRIRQHSGIETAPFIAPASRDFSVQAATHSDINLLPRILLIAVDNRIGESFSYCRFDVFLGSIRKTVLPNETPDKRNELIDEWRDFRTFTGERPPDFRRIVRSAHRT